MKKRIKKWGDSLVIIIDKENADVYNLKEGDIIDITLTKIKKGGKDDTSR